MTNFITLGIGPGGDITHFICVGLTPGAAVIEEPAPAPAPVVSGGGGGGSAGFVRRRRQRVAPTPVQVIGVGEVVLSCADLVGHGTVEMAVEGVGAVAFGAVVQADAAMEVTGRAGVTAAMPDVRVTVHLEDPYATARLLDEAWVMHDVMEGV